MTIKEKLYLIGLRQREIEIALKLYLPTVSFLKDEELKYVLAFLEQKGVKITKASELKVLTLSIDDLKRSFSILGEIGETKLYIDCPILLTSNPIDLYKRIQSCKTKGIPYKNADGYSNIIKSEAAFRNANTNYDARLDDNSLEFSPYVMEEAKIPGISATGIIDLSALDEVESTSEKTTPKSTSFAEIRANLERQKAVMGKFRSDNVLEFPSPTSQTQTFRDEIENGFGIGRAA